MAEELGKKKYGLILPSKKTGFSGPAATRLKPKLFDDELEKEDSDEPVEAVDWVAETLKTQTVKKKQLRITYQKAMEEDPTVYQFDEIYDSMKAKQEKDKADACSSSGSTEKPQARYIDILKKAAEKRQKEYERRQERKIQREREEEGDQFNDKEIFVTSAYRKKMEELMADEAEDRKKQLEDEASDVTKQADITGFYRQMYKDSFAEPSPSETESVKPPEEASVKQVSCFSGTSGKSRHYRQRQKSASPEPEIFPEPVPSNVDADSDIDISEDDGEDDEIVDKAERSAQPSVSRKRKLDVSISEKADDDTFKKPADVPLKKKVEEDKPVEPPKKKIDVRELFKKQTVDILFDEALERYYQRKSQGISALKSGILCH